MKIYKSPVVDTKHLKENVYLIKIHSPELAAEAKPGQFCNIKVSETGFPLLRRPFSVADVNGEFICFMFNVTGEGTKLLAHEKLGQILDILGPLGNGFGYEGNFENAIIVAGGLGSAPFPFLTRFLKGKKIFSFVGGRSEKDVITYGMENYKTATDDGSMGFKGNVVQLLEKSIQNIERSKSRIFACGSTPMLKALQEFSVKYDVDCQISTECAMACGFGICQGCNIESTVHEDKYSLVCIDGPVFNSKEVVL